MTVLDIQRRVDVLDGVYKTLKARQVSLNKEISSIKDDIDVLVKSSAVLKHLLDVMVKDEINKMAGLVTYGLKSVFNDQDISFVPEITKKGERLHIDLKTITNGIEGGFGSFGGSVAVIESFLLRVICLLKKKFAKLLLLDETFAAVGEEYIANTGRLIQELSKKVGLDVLLVTHQKEFQDNADNVYRVKESDNGLVIEKIK
jgi:hypothetical protein